MRELLALLFLGRKVQSEILRSAPLRSEFVTFLNVLANRD
jgi:hypothetical protein